MSERGNGDKESGRKGKYKIPSIRESTVADTISLSSCGVGDGTPKGAMAPSKVCMMQEKKKSARQNSELRLMCVWGFRSY